MLSAPRSTPRHRCSSSSTRQRAAATRTRSATSSKPRCGLADGAGNCCSAAPPSWPSVAHEAADQAIATRTAVVAVGGDGTLNTVAQAAHAVGCAMGVVPQGTFNYFARTHGIPTDPAEAARLLLRWAPAASPGGGDQRPRVPGQRQPGPLPRAAGRPRGLQGALRPQPLGGVLCGLCQRCCARSAGCDCTSRWAAGSRRAPP